MHEARFRPNAFPHPGQEGDHIMARDAFNLINPGDISIGDASGARGAFFADDARGLGRDGADAAHFLSRQGLNLKPDAVAIGGGPDGFHLRAGIARDHGEGSKTAMSFWRFGSLMASLDLLPACGAAPGWLKKL